MKTDNKEKRENASPTAQAQDQVQGGLLLDVVVRQRAALLQLLAGENQALLIRGDALLVLDFCFNIVDGIVWLDFQRDRLAGQRLDKNLHAAAQAQDQVQGGLLLDLHRIFFEKELRQNQIIFVFLLDNAKYEQEISNYLQMSIDKCSVSS
jgi:hypothetical protein